MRSLREDRKGAGPLSNPLIIALIFIVVLAILSGFLIGSPYLKVLQFTTNDVTRQMDGGGWKGSGIFEGSGGTSETGGRELLDDDEYILSWAPDLVGQKVSVGGKAIYQLIAFRCSPYDIEYRLFYEPGHTPAITLKTSIETTVGDLQFGVRQYELKGRTAEGVLQAELWAKCVIEGWFPLAVDQARLLSGIGSITRAKDQVTVGETATFNYRIPYVSDDTTGKGWAIDIYSGGQAKTVVGPMKLSDLSGAVSYRTTTADFSNVTGCRNELRATLRNELWDKAFDVTTVIDITGAGPTLTILGFTPREPEQGDTVTVRWDVRPGALNLPIQKIVVQYGYGGVEVERELTPDTREFSFIVGSQGRVHLVLIAIDLACRPSPTDDVFIQVGEPEPPGALALFAIVFVAVLLVGIILAAIVGRTSGLLFLVIVIAFAVAAFFIATYVQQTYGVVT